MRRAFRGQTCAYCAVRESNTDDHVFAAKFFLEKNRSNLPEVPSCSACNGAKAALEHYLVTVLPFAGRHTQAAENLQTNVPRRLKKNRKLARAIVGSTETIWLRQGGGIYRNTSGFTLDGRKLAELVKYIARGLAWHHWKVYLRSTDAVSTLFLPEKSSQIFQGLIAGMTPKERVHENLGKGTVEYVGLQALDPPELTMWTIAMYGGVLISDDRVMRGDSSGACSTWCAITGPPEVAATFSRWA
jgi:hypothetical protein